MELVVAIVIICVVAFALIHLMRYLEAPEWLGKIVWVIAAIAILVKLVPLIHSGFKL